MLESALFGDLPDAVEPCVVLFAERAATDPDVGQLMDAAVPLANALRYGDVRQTDASSMRSVFDGIVVRILAGVGVACRQLDDDGAAVMVERLTGVQAALAVLSHPARDHALPDVLAQLAGARSGHGLVQGTSDPAAARRRRVDDARCRAAAGTGAVGRNATGNWRCIHRGIPRRLRHRPGA